MENNKHCYDSLEDYLVTHPDKSVSDRAVNAVNVSFIKDESFDEFIERLSSIPESSEYFKWVEKNK